MKPIKLSSYLHLNKQSWFFKLVNSRKANSN
nr:MAG TPA: hypothetical protein [Caudoviricetes sp.]